MIGVKRSATVRAVPAPVAVLCDIHGNAPALEAVLAELRADPPGAVVIGGDVAAGPMPNEVLAALPSLVRLEVGALGEVLFCHGTPRSDEERITVFTPPERLEAVLAPAGAPLVVCGHTHRQFDLAAGGFRMVNAGSVGRPYDREPGAYWLRLGPEDVSLRRTEYDVEAATAKFAALGYPTAREMLAQVDADALARRYEATADKPVDDASLT
jgi:predicted phosphodiesterase